MHQSVEAIKTPWQLFLSFEGEVIRFYLASLDQTYLSSSSFFFLFRDMIHTTRLAGHITPSSLSSPHSLVKLGRSRLDPHLLHQPFLTPPLLLPSGISRVLFKPGIGPRPNTLATRPYLAMFDLNVDSPSLPDFVTDGYR